MEVAYTVEALEDLEQLDASLPGAALLIDGACQVLGQHPLIGRSVEHGLRELVISHGRTAYVALYRFDEARERVIVAAVRHAHEAGDY